MKEINENNLNFLNEEVSQYLSDEDLKTEGLHISQNSQNRYTSPFRTKSEHNPSYFKTRFDALNRELLEKSHQNKLKDNIINNLKTNIKQLHDKLAKYQNSTINMNAQTRQFHEIENENNLIKIEFAKLQENLSNKDNIINEFHKLSEISKSKFKMFEETNLLLREENGSFKRHLDDLREKVQMLNNNDQMKENKMNEYKNIKFNLEKQIEDMNSEIFKKEEKIRAKFEEKERKIKEKFKDREDNLKNEYFKEINIINMSVEGYKLENEKLKIEIKNLKNLLEASENSLQENEIEFKKALDQKDKDYQKLQKNLKELQNDIHELESKYTDKTHEYQTKLKNAEETETKLLHQIQFKEKKFKELDEEFSQMRGYLMDLQASMREYEIKTDTKDKIIAQLKNQNKEILKEFNKKESEYTYNEESKYDLGMKCNALFEENEELKENLLKASENLQKLNELIEDKYSGLEMNLHKEKSKNENNERKYREAMKKMKDNEQRLNQEIDSLKDLLVNQQDDFEKVRNRYDSKIQSVLIKR